MVASAASPVRQIVFAVAPHLVLLDACGPLEAFWRAELELRHARKSVGAETIAYRTRVASIEGGILPTHVGLPVIVERLDALESEPIDTIIVAGTFVADQMVLDAELVKWLERIAPRARRVCSVCVGAFYLAAAGLLDGRRATTHWRSADELARCFPAIQVDADPIFVRDMRGGRAIWTSAGVTAGIDLALALIEEDFGHTVAMQAARRLVVFMKRPGGQSQFSATLDAQQCATAEFDALHAWMVTNLHGDLSVERLAERARMSPRTFARRYVDAVGRTPAKTVEAMRLEAAAHSLAESRRPMKRIALDCGFGTEQNLRRAFVRRFGVPPLNYRERFAPISAAG